MLLIDMNAKVACPDEREFDFDCEVEVMQDRVELVHAALTLLRAHAVAGWPKVPGRRPTGSFEEWDRLVADAIVFAGGTDVRKLFGRLKEADPEISHLRQIIQMVDVVTKGEPTRVSVIVSRVEGLPEDVGFDRLEDKVEQMQLLERLGGPKRNAITIGKRLANQSERIVDGRWLRHDGGKNRENVMKFWV